MKHMPDTDAIDYIQTLDSATKAELEKREVYMRFLFERERLTRMASEELESCGELTDLTITEQNKLVSDLGQRMIEEAETIKFMLAEPSYNEFQRLKG